MSHARILFIPTHATLPARFLLVDREGRVVGRGELDPHQAEPPPPMRTIAVAPGADVMTRWLDLPPGNMAQARAAARWALRDQAAGEVDGICVGEPWNSIAVDRGVGRIALATAQIWRRGVEKVLAMRADQAEERRDAVLRLIRALHAAAAHFVDPETVEQSAEILSRTAYLDAPVDAILRAITDRIRVVPGGEPVHYPDFMFQYREAANFPWRSQAGWLHAQMVRWEGLPFSNADAATAQGVFRPDLYRAALTGSGAPLPGASSKLEGALIEPIGAGSTQGRLVLGSDRFFDGRAFDPDDIPGYLAALP